MIPQTKSREKTSGAGTCMHTFRTKKKKNEPHKRNSCFHRVFLRGSSALQRFQTTYRASAHARGIRPQLDASLQGGARLSQLRPSHAPAGEPPVCRPQHLHLEAQQERGGPLGLP